MINEKDILAYLEKVQYPGFSRNFVSFVLVKSISIEENDVVINIELATKDPSIPKKIHNDSQEAINLVPGIGNVKINIDIKSPPEQIGENTIGQSSLPGVKKIIAVASGKGGVGKSTVATNIAVALSLLDENISVGLCDCDLYGPSIPLMFGQESVRPTATDENEIIPIESHGIKLMSIGFILDSEAPTIWRGPMVMKALEQMFNGVEWGELDYLIIDLPPGTGDAQLTLAQSSKLSGSIVISTPQDVALTDARKGINMFKKVNVDILGIVENMSYFTCPKCGERSEIFSHGGAKNEADRLGCDLLGEIPLDIEIRATSDQGHPITVSQPDGAHAKSYTLIATNVWSRIEHTLAAQEATAPNIVIQ